MICFLFSKKSRTKHISVSKWQTFLSFKILLSRKDFFTTSLLVKQQQQQKAFGMTGCRIPDRYVCPLCVRIILSRCSFRLKNAWMSLTNSGTNTWFISWIDDVSTSRHLKKKRKYYIKTNSEVSNFLNTPLLNNCPRRHPSNSSVY